MVAAGIAPFVNVTATDASSIAFGDTAQPRLAIEVGQAVRTFPQVRQRGIGRPWRGFGRGCRGLREVRKLVPHALRPRRIPPVVRIVGVTVEGRGTKRCEVGIGGGAARAERVAGN